MTASVVGGVRKRQAPQYRTFVELTIPAPLVGGGKALPVVSRRDELSAGSDSSEEDRASAAKAVPRIDPTSNVSTDEGVLSEPELFHDNHPQPRFFEALPADHGSWDEHASTNLRLANFDRIPFVDDDSESSYDDGPYQLANYFEPIRFVDQGYGVYEPPDFAHSRKQYIPDMCTRPSGHPVYMPEVRADRNRVSSRSPSPVYREHHSRFKIRDQSSLRDGPARLTMPRSISNPGSFRQFARQQAACSAVINGYRDSPVADRNPRRLVSPELAYSPSGRRLVPSPVPGHCSASPILENMRRVISPANRSPSSFKACSPYPLDNRRPDLVSFANSTTDPDNRRMQRSPCAGTVSDHQPEMLNVFNRRPPTPVMASGRPPAPPPRDVHSVNKYNEIHQFIASHIRQQVFCLPFVYLVQADTTW